MLTPRDTVDDHRDDLEAYSCGLYATANGIDISINSNNLFDEVDKSVTLPANSCGRIACYDTTGVHGK